MPIDLYAVIAASLANGGINPFSGEKVFDNADTVKHVLS